MGAGFDEDEEELELELEDEEKKVNAEAHDQTELAKVEGFSPPFSAVSAWVFQRLYRFLRLFALSAFMRWSNSGGKSLSSKPCQELLEVELLLLLC